MWRFALLGTASLVAASNGAPNNAKRCSDGNSSIPLSSPSLASQLYPVADGTPSSVTVFSSSRVPASYASTTQSPDYSVVDLTPSADITTITVLTVQTPSAAASPYAPNSFSSDVAPSLDSTESSTSTEAQVLTWSAQYPTTKSQIDGYVPSQAPYPYKNATRTSSIGTSAVTSVFRGRCTGCALAALNPMTTSYQSDMFGPWTSLVVTETILTEFVTYVDNSTIDTVVTETKTVNQTKTVNGYITDTAAEFNIYLPTPGLDLTLEVGPTYVIYTSLFGGPDAQVAVTAPNNATQSKLKPPKSTCRPQVSSLTGWIPTQTQLWDFFIQTFANGTTPSPTIFNSPVPLPSNLQNYLAQDPELQILFQDADIATCTPVGLEDMLIGNPSRTFGPPPAVPSTLPAELTSTQMVTATVPATTQAPPMFSRPGTNTYLSTTYATTSKHITKQGCLRCDTKAGDRPQTPKPPPQDPNTDNINGKPPAPTNSPDPKKDDPPNPDNSPKSDGKPQDQPPNTPQPPPKPDVNTTPSIPDFISSVVKDNPDLTNKPQERPTGPAQTITIGNSVVTVKPQPTNQGQRGPNQQSNVPTMVIIGTETVTIGQTTTINGVPVVVPTAGGGSTIVVGDKTIGISPRITQTPMPVLTVGHNTITANPEGQFVVGTQTLQRGGPIIVLDDQTLTLGPNGKIAIWNSASQTLVTMNGQPAVTFGGEEITAKILRGTTVFILGDKTLGPGGAVTVDGTTFSLPSGFHGSSIVINGQTQRLSAGLPVLTVDNSQITAIVAGGTTEFVLAPGQTLTPGGVLTVSGTTYSLPTEGQGSTIIVNGATSRLNPSHLPVLPFSDEEVTATIAHGTTAFVFGPEETLTPGGVVTVSGTTLSLPASGSGTVVVINGVTSTLGSGSGMGIITSAPPIVVDGQTLTATTRDGTVEYVLNSATTLFPGGQVVIDGTTYSLLPGGTAVVVDGKTSTLSRAPASNSASTTTTERGAGDFIASGIGETSRGVGSWAHGGGADKWAERLVMGAAGWLLWMV
ncbi:hypothetical protein SVAN01_05187 [Stagonosporopsis vannaccii]|nr:hypothetical protein SVAN01_05187 [Stagonosporopsis vannaccii]